MRNGLKGLQPSLLEVSVAVYKVEKMKDGTIRLWARYTPFKGAATKSHIVAGPPEDTYKMAMQAAEWVAKQRKPRAAD